MSHQVLALDSAGSPSCWLPLKDAILYQVNGKVAWSIGEAQLSMRGGVNRITGQISEVSTPGIIAIKGHHCHQRA